MKNIEFWNSIIYDLESFGMTGDCTFHVLSYIKPIGDYTNLIISIVDTKEDIEDHQVFSFAIKIASFDYIDKMYGKYVKEEDMKTIINLKEKIVDLMLKENERLTESILKFHSVQNNSLFLCTEKILYVIPKYGESDYFYFKSDGKHYREAKNRALL
jgi:hypothetical protein